MTSPAALQNESPTLTQRLTSGKLPPTEALRYALLLAEALRRLHDAGRCHGSLTPDHILLIGSGIELVPPSEPPAPGPYTAPELQPDRGPDQRSDTFAFGCILFEMLTGRRAFEDGNTDAPTPSSGSPTVDKLLRSCLQRDPAARYQRLQKLMMELKMLTVALRRADTSTTSKAEVTDAALRAEIAQLESRLSARLQEHDTGLTTIEQGASEALAGFRSQLTALNSQLEAEQGRHADEASTIREALQQFGDRLTGMQTAAAAETSSSQAALEQVESRIAARLQTYEQRIAGIERAAESLNAVQNEIAAAVSQAAAVSEQTAARLENLAEKVNQRLLGLEEAHTTDGEWVRKVEASLDAFDKDAAALRDSVTNDLRNYDRAIKSQAAAIESARTAMAQTDDLVERVVEALESLQSVVLETAEAK